MLEKRKANTNTESTSVKVRQWTIISATKREYTVSSNLESKANY